ncbi:LysR family transcriptional regulator [Bdellovibrio bacteriovorus]|uniref:LysR family transcriptional regulator n=1 Tax=Bdellovibrio bacteriovorus str. Tiberius TaxID=1069642 RepID=K7ZGN4_BDEBC|nr:LysR family transcriptional regulator [Bdellovibrio bacteriovorus]AFY02682.1 LysR family transcriptional regulator [Bdellovibrio bacteriovorus str. Tiberius]
MPVRIENQVQWLNYHHLHYFHVIAKEGSIAKAAEKLNMGQPTLSIQLKQLEESLGKNLFERRKQRLFLTEAGKIAYEYADQVFRLGAEMVEVLQDRLQNNRVHVQIGALDSVPKPIISEVVLQAYKQGNCAVSVLEGASNDLLRELSAHQIDLLLSNYPPNVDFQTVYAKSIAKLDVVVCASAKYKHLRRDFPYSLEGQPFIFPTIHSRLRRDLEHYFSINGIRVDRIAETQDTSLQKLLGQEGVGLIPIVEVAASDLIREKKLVVLGTLPGIYEEIWLMAANRKIDNPIAAKLMKGFTL